MRRSVKGTLIICCALLALVGGIVAWAATKTVDLDGNGTAESSVALNVLTTFPAKVENVITDKAVGASFTFNWVSSGPGGFTGNVGPGTTAGVGAKWTWQTSKAVYSFTGNSCANDICFTATAGLPAGTVRGPFRVPGRSLVSSGVTVSNASLTSSLVTFFSPPKTIFSATSSVGQPGSGQVSYSTTLANSSAGALTVHVDAGPPGCCPNANQLNCDGTCVDYLTDEDNCGGCGEAFACDTFHGQICEGGACVTTCTEGQTLCGEVCVDTDSDRSNCGGCGVVCGESQVCTDSACVDCPESTPNVCNNDCVNLYTDGENCGGCGITCSSECPSCGSGSCVEGSCYCAPEDDINAPIISASINSGSSMPSPKSETPPPLPPPAPICETQAVTETIPAGQSASLGCNAAGFLAKEVFSFIKVCLDGSTPNPTTGLCSDQNAPTSGPFIQLVPDSNHPIGSVNVAITPVGVGVLDLTGDGLLEPGEIALLNISVANSGSAAITGATATLTSPPQDITPDDGISNPTSVGIVLGRACYPDIPGAPAPSNDCSAAPALNPVRGLTPFIVFVPPNYLGDSSRVFNLRFTGTANGAPISQDVPITLGIAGTCNPLDIQGNYDGLRGLDFPLAQLIPEDDNRPLPFPIKSFPLSNPRPMRLTMSCGRLNLDNAKTSAPRIVGLFNLTTNQPVDISNLTINDSLNSNDPFFRFSGSPSTGGWTYVLRARSLAVGRYRLTVEIDGRKNYVTGFELK